MEAIILAGGLGTRLRTACSDRPKPMAPVANRPFLEHLLDYWIDQGVTHFILSVGYLHTLISSHFGSEYKKTPITYSIEETPLGTGGGLLTALPYLKNSSTFLLLNGDTFFPISLTCLLTFHKKVQAECTLALHSRADNPRYDSLLLSPSGQIKGFNINQTTQNYLINGGCYLFERAVLSPFSIPTKPISFEKEILPSIIDRQKCFGFQFHDLFIDIGLPEDFHRSQSLLKMSNDDPK